MKGNPLEIDVRVSLTWAQLETDGLEPHVLDVLGDALRLGYALGHRDGAAGLAFPGSTERPTTNG